MPRISVALATYNGAAYLEEQLHSLAAQTRLPDELVVSDDCSTDATVPILQAFSRSAPFEVRIAVNEKTLGVGGNFAKAARMCTGDLIFFCDQDDVWHPEKLDRVSGEFERHPGAMVVLNDARLVDAQLRTTGRTLYGNIRSAGAPDRHFITGCCSAHRRAWQRLALPLPGWIGFHDLWINLFAHDTGCARILPLTLQDYRRHESAATDWVLSEPGERSKLQLFQMHGLKDAREGWRESERMLQEMADRLEGADNRDFPLTGCALDEARRRVSLRREAVANRIALCSMPRWRRPPQLLRSWLRGHYNQFSGWKSAAKDLVRP